jgi:hypothetical protein
MSTNTELILNIYTNIKKWRSVCYIAMEKTPGHIQYSANCGHAKCISLNDVGNALLQKVCLIRYKLLALEDPEEFSLKDMLETVKSIVLINYFDDPQMDRASLGLSEIITLLTEYLKDANTLTKYPANETDINVICQIIELKDLEALLLDHRDSRDSKIEKLNRDITVDEALVVSLQKKLNFVKKRLVQNKETLSNEPRDFKKRATDLNIEINECTGKIAQIRKTNQAQDTDTQDTGELAAIQAENAALKTKLAQLTALFR